MYTVMEAIAAVVAAILLAARTRKSVGVVYGKLDQVGRIINIVLIPVYVCLSPLLCGAAEKGKEQTKLCGTVCRCGGHWSECGSVLSAGW